MKLRSLLLSLGLLVSVLSLHGQGPPPISTINAGTNVTVTRSGPSVTISSTGGGGSNAINLSTSTGLANTASIVSALGTTTSLSGGGTIALGGFTVTVPATGTAALLNAAQTFTGSNTFNTGAFSVSSALNANINYYVFDATNSNTFGNASYVGWQLRNGSGDGAMFQVAGNSVGAGTTLTVTTTLGFNIVVNGQAILNTTGTISTMGGSNNQFYKYSNSTDATSTTAASVTYTGGIGIGKSLFVGGQINTTGGIIVGTAGSTTSYSKYGIVTLSSGVATITNSVITSNSTTIRVWGPVSFNGVSSLSGTIGVPAAYASVIRTGSASFTAASTDNSVYYYQIIISPDTP